MTKFLLKPVLLIIQRKKFILAMATIPLFSLCILFSSCKKDETKNCDRSCYLGEWTANDIKPGNTLTYTTNIFASPTGPDNIIIDDFHDYFEAEAAVNGSSFTIPMQEAGQNQYFVGTGTLSEDGKIITVEYEEEGGVIWTGTWTKQ